MSSRRIKGFVIAVIAGLVMARVLPYIFPLASPLEDAWFGEGISSARDRFNSFAMTAITFATSSVISFHVFRKP
jgi:hypothetical protein